MNKEIIFAPLNFVCKTRFILCNSSSHRFHLLVRLRSRSSFIAAHFNPCASSLWVRACMQQSCKKFARSLCALRTATPSKAPHVLLPPAHTQQAIFCFLFSVRCSLLAFTCSSPPLTRRLPAFAGLLSALPSSVRSLATNRSLKRTTIILPLCEQFSQHTIVLRSHNNWPLLLPLRCTQ